MSDPAQSAHRQQQKLGLSPGSVVFVGEARSAPIAFSVIDYDRDTIEETETRDLDAVRALRDTSTVSWINVSGVHDAEVIQDLGAHFGLHPLVQEDIANTAQRPKLEEYGDYLFIVVKMLYLDASGSAARNSAAPDEAVSDGPPTLQSEQVSLIVGPQYVLSFQEEPGDVFDPVRHRLRVASKRIRERGADYLAYALLDVIVDHYFVVLEAFGDRAEALEDDVLDDDVDDDTQAHINALRRDLITVRRMVWPARELISQLERSDSPLIDASTRPFLRDAYDHAVQVIDLVESLRDVASSLTDLYMTTLSNRMNEIMKVLTIIGTIFIPLTFVAGIYGMNFSYMPELEYRYGYPVAMAVMLTVGIVLLFYFRRRDWI